jgi:CRISPR-associated endonuclease Csn1
MEKEVIIGIDKRAYIHPKEMDFIWNVKYGKASGSFDSKTASFNGKSIKDSFIKLKIDRLGNISKA